MDKTYLQEAFHAMELLEEEDFRLDDVGVKDILDFKDHDELNDIIDVMDPEADSEEELQDSYIGSVILECQVCHSPIFMDVEDVDVATEGDVVNMDTECPICHSQDGFKIIGQVAPFQEDPEINVEIEDKDDADIDDSIDDIEESVESSSLTDKNRFKNESLNEAKEDDEAEDESDSEESIEEKVADLEDRMDVLETEVAEFEDSVADNDEEEILDDEEILDADVLDDEEIEDEVVDDEEILDVDESLNEGNKPLFKRELTDKKTGTTISVSSDKSAMDADREAKKFARSHGGENQYDMGSSERQMGSVTSNRKDADGEPEKLGAEVEESLNEDIYRQYEDPYKLQKEYDALKRKRDKIIASGDTKADTDDQLMDIDLKLAELKDRINFAWQDDEYDKQDESLTEGFEKIDLETEDKIIHVSEEEKEPVPDMEMITPVSDELASEITAPETDDVPEEEPIDDMSFDDTELGDMGDDSDEEIDYDVDDFDENEFDDLGESYLKNVYENVNSFKTSKVSQNDNQLIIEGVINFNSGKSKATKFVFEAKDATKSGKVRFIGENAQITRGKKAFTLAGTMSGSKFIAESLNYNYRVNSNRVYGTVKSNK